MHCVPQWYSQGHQYEGEVEHCALLQWGHQADQARPNSGTQTIPHVCLVWSYCTCTQCCYIIQVYYYADSKTMHTTYPDGLEVLEFPKYMVDLCCNVHLGGPSAHLGRLMVRWADGAVG